jgi:hypothetical protein
MCRLAKAAMLRLERSGKEQDWETCKILENLAV